MFYTARADEHEDLGDYDAAEADVRRALEISPQSARVLTHMGNVLSDQDEHEAALAYYDRAIALNPLNPRARMGRGDAYRVLDRWQEAVVDYEKATVYDRENASLYYFLSWGLSNELQRFEDAIDYAQRAHELEPGNRHYLFNLIVAKHGAKDCSVVGEMEEYVALCEDSGECERRLVDWAHDKASSLRSSAYCG